jgi:hypothetical protein
MTTVKEQLAKVDSLLGTILEQTITKAMTAADFAAYATDQIRKSTQDMPDVSLKRLKALQGQVQLFKDNYVDDTASVAITVFDPDVTSYDEKSSKTIAVDGLESGPDGMFGLTKKLADLQKVADDAVALFQAKADAPAPPKPPAPPGQKPDTAANSDELEDADKKAKAKKAEDDEAEEKRKAKDAEEAEKGLDVGSDGTVWPADLAAMPLGKGETIAKADRDWGSDTSKAARK